MQNVSYEPYAPRHYQSLPEFDDVKALQLTPDIIDQIQVVFHRWNLQDVLGLTLLHKHFPITDSELLVRRHDTASNQITGSVVPIAGTSDLVDYIWRYVGDETLPRLTPIEFLAADSDLSYFRLAARLVRASSSFHTELFGVLHRAALLDKFGLSLLPDRLFSVTSGETLVENTVESTRTLKIHKVAVGSFNKANSTKTLWNFPKGTSGMKPQIICISHCGSHCKVHCAIHCASHCGAHCKSHNVA
jgi:hypothetical protein